MNLSRILVQYPILLFAITVHEYAHGKVAEFFGDDTARLAGRLTLNPLAHIDLIGTLVLPLLAMISGLPFIGWAKPVPVNMYILTRKQIMFVGFAGPLANFGVAILFGLFYRIMYESFVGVDIMFYYAVVINIVLGVFNLIPIPPLDGSKILKGLLPYNLAYEYESLVSRYGFLLITMLIFSGVLWQILSPVVEILIGLILPSVNL